MRGNKGEFLCLRKINGYSQEEIAEKIGISRQAYGKWEKGETVPDVEKCGLGECAWKQGGIPIHSVPLPYRPATHLMQIS